MVDFFLVFFFFQAEDGIRDLVRSRGLGDVYKRQGAFTEAMLDAFSGKSCQDTDGEFQADSDHDRILRLGELYDFLRRRVPALVQGLSLIHI